MRTFIALLFTLLSITAFGQILEPVKWNMESRAINDSEYELVFTAKIDDGWKVYSQFLEEEDGPIPTSFNFDQSDHFELVGKTEEAAANRKKQFDEVFKMDLITFTKQGIFTQKVKVTDHSKPITGYLEYMCCDATRCLPPTEVDFEFKLQPATDKTETESATPPVEEKTDEPLADTKEQPAVNEKEEKEEANKRSSPAETTTLAKTKDDVTRTDADVNKTAVTSVASSKSTNQQPEAVEENTTTEETTADDAKNPATWTVAIQQKDGDLYELSFVASLKDGWYTYSQFTEEGGPIPTTFYYTESNHYELVGDAKEIGELKEAPEPVFGGVMVKKFVSRDAKFVQQVRVSDPSQPIEGELEFMACNNEMCTPPLPISFRFLPDQMTGQIATDLPAIVAATDTETALQNCSTGEETIKGKGLWSIFGLGFLGGLLALLTPCVFPMIPLTVSFFTKSSGTRQKGLMNASLYGFFILLVYLVLSIPFHLMDSINPDILNEISTNTWLNVFFFLIFMFFAGSFFGFYELTLPSSWVSKSSSAEGVGGLAGIFFMALTLALVSFSCTGPILGSLLAGALTSSGGAWQLTAGMGGFGLALALPFAVFAAFPTLMNSLPKSGGWLNTVKVVLGFLEVAAAFKFLSNADLVSHWGILKVEPFLIIWMLTFIGLGLYLFGKIKFPHDSPVKKISPLRAALGIASFAFVAYMGTGLIYDDEVKSLPSLSLLSGLAPPACYSMLYPCDCPQNLNCFKDFEQGISHAKEVEKPILLDFTGYACVNCRKMEENVWPVDKVYEQLKEEYILVSLYVDDKKELPEEEQIKVTKSNGTTRTLRSYGHKWAHFQAERFQVNTQPYYVLLAPDGETVLNTPVGYTPDEDEYAAFLRCGLESYEKYRQQQGVLGMKE